MRLIAQPQPGELDQCCSQPRIAGFGHPLLPINCSALPRCRRQARISGDLASVVEVSEEPLRPKDGGEFWPDALYVKQHRCGRRHGGYCHGQQRVPLALHGLDLLEKQLEPIEFTFDLRFEMRGKGRPSPV